MKQMLSSRMFDSRIHSANTTGSEKWLGYFLGPVGAATLNFTVVSYLNVFYTDVLDLTNAFPWVAAFLALFPIISKIVDAITNLLMGQIIEKTHSRQGKARPWLLVSAPLMTLAMILLFMIPREHSIWQIVLVALTYNIFFSFAYTIYNMSHTLMVPLSTTNVRQRDGLSLFSNIGGNMLPGTVVALLFPAVIMPMLGADYDKWVLVMSILACLSLPFTLIEYYFTKERVTEAAHSTGEVKNVSFREQLAACFSSKYWIMMVVYMLMFQIMSNIMTISLPYFCNWVLGTYNDGTTQALLSVVGKAPLGFGVFILWPLVKKFGKRKVMIVGFLTAAAAMGFCLTNPRSMPVMLAGSLIYALGFLPSYVYTALMADTLDYVEYDKGIRADGLTASVFTIVMTISVGIGQGIFNMGLTTAGYVAPVQGADGVWNVQNAATQDFITFAYVAIPLICLAVMAIIMIFLNVENHLPMVHEKLNARRRAEAQQRGEVYVSPEEKAAQEEEAKHQAAMKAKQEKAAAKKKK